MQKIVPFLWFDNNLDQALQFYTGIFKDTKVLNEARLPGAEGKLLTATFELEGQQFMALNGGPNFKFTEAVSFFVKCDTQEEIDYYWNSLAAGGEEQACGWLKDKFGLSWQIVPPVLGRLLGDKDPRRAQNVMNAMMQMAKIDIGKLMEAYEKE